MKARIAALVTGAALVSSVVLAGPAQAGSTAYDFYYGPKFTPKVLGFYGQATNYDSHNHTRQTYHWAFKKVPVGYKPARITTCGGTELAAGRWSGYTEIGIKSWDCVVKFEIMKISNSSLAPSTYIPASAWK